MIIIIGTAWVYFNETQHYAKGASWIFYLSIVHLVMALWPSIVGCFKKCCGKEDDNVEKGQV